VRTLARNDPEGGLVPPTENYGSLAVPSRA
jgi:hypothetical protein